MKKFIAIALVLNTFSAWSLDLCVNNDNNIGSWEVKSNSAGSMAYWSCEEATENCNFQNVGSLCVYKADPQDKSVNSHDSYGKCIVLGGADGDSRLPNPICDLF